MAADDWTNDPYTIEWLGKVAERTAQYYKERCSRWLVFINMNPSEQIHRRFKDLQSSNPKERGFFEEKTIDYKDALVTQGLKANSVMSYIISVTRFFSARRVPLRFKRKELRVEKRAQDKVVRDGFLTINR